MRRLLPVVSLALVACATTGAEFSTVQVETQSGGHPLAGAICVIFTPRGSQQIVTPATVSMGDERGDMRVVCDKPGFRSSEFIYRPALAGGSSFGLGAGSGGRFGFGFGLSFPLGGGSSRYPERIVVDLNPQ